MPTAGDMAQFLGGQSFGSTSLPKADLSGKTFVVTGSNTGIGLECAKHLARMNVSTLILGCRSIEKGNKAMEAIYASTNCKGRTSISVWPVDLASYAFVSSFGKRVRSELGRLDGFVANAGVEMKQFERSESGLELSLVVNVLSTVLMAIAVLPKLRETSAAHGTRTNLAIVGSMVHALGKEADLEAVPASRDIFEGLSDPALTDMGNRYCLSKTLLHLAFNELARRANPDAAKSEKPEAGVVVNVVNPGWCASELGRHKTMGVPERAMFAMIGRTSEEGARTLVHAATAGAETHACYLSECRVKPQSAFVRSERGHKMQERVWRDLLARLRSADPEMVGTL